MLTFKYNDIMLAMQYIEKNCQHQPIQIYIDSHFCDLFIKTFRNDGCEVEIQVPNKEKSIHVTISEKRWLCNVLK
jgi:hypothetical protein